MVTVGINGTFYTKSLLDTCPKLHYLGITVANDLKDMQFDPPSMIINYSSQEEGSPKIYHNLKMLKIDMQLFTGDMRNVILRQLPSLSTLDIRQRVLQFVFRSVDSSIILSVSSASNKTTLNHMQDFLLSARNSKTKIKKRCSWCLVLQSKGDTF